MGYKIEELDVKGDSEEEQKRSRVIFENLRDKANKSEKLTEHEKDFFCQGIKLSIHDDGNIEDYECCSNFRFKITYLTYFHDLTGFGSYSKPKGTSLYQPDRKEIDRDIEYLKTVALNWLKTIETTNHSEEMLQQVSIETRGDMKAIEKTKGKLLFRRDKERYVLDKRRTLLQSKYIYCRALQIFEMFDSKDFILNLNGLNIEINGASIIHVLNRHFSQITKPKSTKSFHIEDFDPKYLNKQLKVIFDAIEKSGFFKGQPINKIAFKYEGIDYRIWVNKRTKQIVGQGNVEFNRLDTFYPIENTAELQDLMDNYELRSINENLEVYTKK